MTKSDNVVSNLKPVSYLNVAVFISETDVPGFKPPVIIKSRLGRRCIVQVTDHDVRAGAKYL